MNLETTPDPPGSDIVPLPGAYVPTVETRSDYWDRVFDYVRAVELAYEARGYDCIAPNKYKKPA